MFKDETPRCRGANQKPQITLHQTKAVDHRADSAPGLQRTPSAHYTVYYSTLKTHQRAAAAAEILRFSNSSSGRPKKRVAEWAESLITICPEQPITEQERTC